MKPTDALFRKAVKSYAEYLLSYFGDKRHFDPAKVIKQPHVVDGRADFWEGHANGICSTAQQLLRMDEDQEEIDKMTAGEVDTKKGNI